jgi:hypothetical protein
MKIRAYWHSGLIAVRRSAGLFAAWERALHRHYDAELVDDRWPQFMDQISWAMVTTDAFDDVRILSAAYNYPLRHRQSLSGGAMDLDLTDIAHLHYRLWFHMPDSLDTVEPRFDPTSDRYAWLSERLPLEPLVEAEEPEPASD